MYVLYALVYMYVWTCALGAKDNLKYFLSVWVLVSHLAPTPHPFLWDKVSQWHPGILRIDPPAFPFKVLCLRAHPSLETEFQYTTLGDVVQGSVEFTAITPFCAGLIGVYHTLLKLIFFNLKVLWCSFFAKSKHSSSNLSGSWTCGQ